MKAKVGIIGLGKSGIKHLKAYLKKPKLCTVVGIVDFDKKKIALIKKKYPFLKVFKSDYDLISDDNINTVSICSFDQFHFRQIKYCVKFNKNIFCEKPICIHQDHLIKIRNIVTKKNIHFGCNFVLRTVPLFNKFKKNLINKRIGKIFSIEANYNSGRLEKITKGWRGKIKNYSIIHGGLVHMIDLILWITNFKEIKGSVTSFSNSICTKNYNLKIEDDFVSVLIKMKNNIILRLNASFGITTPHHHEIKIYGTKFIYINNLFFKGAIAKQENKLKKTKFSELYPGKNQNNIIFNFLTNIYNNKVNKDEIKNIFSVSDLCFAIQESLKTKKK